MKYNSGAYNQNINYLGISFGNYNEGAYNSPLRYNVANRAFTVPNTVDLYVVQGNQYNKVLIVKDNDGNPLDLSGCYFTGSISKYSQTTKQNISVLLVDAKAGKILVNIPANQASTLTESRYVFDIFAHTSNVDFEIFNGQMLINNR
jgi:hypothetical protein